MDTPSFPTAPARLYALHLKLRPIQYGTLMPFTGELVHAAWLDWLRSAAPDVATWLHEGNKRRLFTCSSLQFPFPPARMREAERNNTHLPLEPEKTYTIRITLLLGELFPLFHQALTNFNLSNLSDARKPPFIHIAKQSLLLEEVIAGQDDPDGWTGFTSFKELVEQVRTLRLGKNEPLKLEFASLTTFNRGSAKQKDYGNHHARLPLPQYVFSNLAKRWADVAPPEYARLVQQDLIEQYIQDEGLVIADYDLKTHQVKFTTHTQPGFIGTCKYILRGPDDPISEEHLLTVRQQLILLSHLAFYCGVGYKTAMGMGRVRKL